MPAFGSVGRFASIRKSFETPTTAPAIHCNYNLLIVNMCTVAGGANAAQLGHYFDMFVTIRVLIGVMETWKTSSIKSPPGDLTSSDNQL
jgi:hypothetical protein